MANYGILPTGFASKTLRILIDEFREQLVNSPEFGSDIDFTSGDPLYQLSLPFLIAVEDLWSLAEDVFNGFSIVTSEANNLSKLGRNIGVSRRQASKSIGQVTFTGTDGIIVPIGFQVSTVDGVVFETTTSGAISSGNLTVDVVAVIAGANGNVSANTIIQLVSPLIGVVSVSNTLLTAGGQNQESDIAYRARYQNATEGSQGPQAIAIRNALLQLSGVTGASVFENEEDVIVNGLVPHSVRALVTGGVDAEIVQTIYETKAGGINTNGTTSLTVEDAQGEQHTVRFDRPTNVDIYIRLDITKLLDYPDGGDDVVKAAVVSRVLQLGAGTEVSTYRIIQGVNSANVAGIENVTVTLSTDDITYTDATIVINADQVPVTELTKVAIL